MKTRKNKSYTSILLEEMNKTEFIKANELYDLLKSQGLNVVIKPTDKAFKAMVQDYNQTIDSVALGETLEIIGVPFKATGYLHQLKTFEYNDYKGNTEIVTPFMTASSILVIGLYETIFETYTGKLINF